MTRQPTTDPVTRKRHAARALQALTGILIASAAVACYDVRAGFATLGFLLIATSAPWRTAQ